MDIVAPPGSLAGPPEPATAGCGGGQAGPWRERSKHRAMCGSTGATMPDQRESRVWWHFWLPLAIGAKMRNTRITPGSQAKYA